MYTFFYYTPMVNNNAKVNDAATVNNHFFYRTTSFAFYFLYQQFRMSGANVLENQPPGDEASRIFHF